MFSECYNCKWGARQSICPVVHGTSTQKFKDEHILQNHSCHYQKHIWCVDSILDTGPHSLWGECSSNFLPCLNKKNNFSIKKENSFSASPSLDEKWLVGANKWLYIDSPDSQAKKRNKTFFILRHFLFFLVNLFTTINSGRFGSRRNQIILTNVCGAWRHFMWVRFVICGCGCGCAAHPHHQPPDHPFLHQTRYIHAPPPLVFNILKKSQYCFCKPLFLCTLCE